MTERSPIERAFLDKRIGVVFLSERLVRRVIKEHRQIGGVGFQVSHSQGYSLPAWALRKIVEASELGDLDPAHETVLVLPQPAGGDQATLVATWRAAFHASIHRAFEARIMAGGLPPAIVRARIHSLGQTEFDEIRYVLRQDDQLLPPHDDTETYIEFAATYLELKYFAPDLLLRTFPGVREEQATVDRTIARDLDAEALLTACQPAGAPGIAELWATLAGPPESRPPPQSIAPHVHRNAVDPSADAAREKGNAIRSLLLRVRATGTELSVERELTAFCDRLSAALIWIDAPTQEWSRVLLPVLHHARTTLRLPSNAESRILFDLQKACIDNEREREALGIVEWALSFGKVPIRRPLSAQRDVRIAAHVIAALRKVPKTRLPEGPRNALVQFLVTIAERAEQNVRTSMTPKLEAALDEVGLTPVNVPEVASRRKLIDELLDQVLKHRVITLGHVRDALSRNNIKLGNITPGELLRGDALLRMDKRLARTLDGVYYPGEIYLRALQKLSSLTFGTRVGRVLTLYALLPLVSAYVLLEGLQHTVWALVRKLGAPDVAFASPTPLAILSLVALALIHSRRARDVGLALWAGTKWILKGLFISAPAWVWRNTPLKEILKTEAIRQLVRFVFKPLLVSFALATLAFFFTKKTLTLGIVWGALFLVSNLVLNSPIGRAIEETGADLGIRSWRQLSQRLLPGLFGLVVATFKRAVEMIDRFIYYVNEKLIFREGESRPTLWAKAGVGVVWFFTTYLIRIYVNLLIEPEVNPVKHFPVVTVAHKLTIGVLADLHEVMYAELTPIFGVVLAESFIAPTLFVLPGFFGFLVWELKENWRLYRMNRNVFLSPVILGAHGETMVQFMKPGLHSGTIPKAYSKLRRASRKLDQSALKHTEALRSVENSVRKFIERELIFLFKESPAWTAGELSLGKVALSSNRVKIELRCPSISNEPAIVVFDEQSGFLLAQIPTLGFIERLPIVDRIVLENGLAGLYKMAGVDLVREQVAQITNGSAYDISDNGLVVWPDDSYKNEIVYDVTRRGPTIRAYVRAGVATLPEPVLAAQLVFERQDIAWASWVSAFATREDPPRRLNQGPPLFVSGQATSSVDRTVTLKRLA